MLTATLVIDYTYDLAVNGGNDFFTANATAKAALEAAATLLSSKLGDSLDAITPGGANTWTTNFTHPGTGATQLIVNPTIAADTIVVYAGGRNLPSGNLGRGGPGGYSASGFQSWFDAINTRGEGSGLSSATQNSTPDMRTANEFAPWGGSITFDSVGVTWHFNHTTAPAPGTNDFYSVALHELTHLLGMGTSDSYHNLMFGANGDEIAVWRSGNFLRDLSGNNAWNGTSTDELVTFGATNDTPIVGDWNGDGFDEIGVWRAGQFFLDFNGNGAWDGAVVDRLYVFGATTDTPIVGNWDGDGDDEIGVYRGGTGAFYKDINGNGAWDGVGIDSFVVFGAIGDRPLIGDWNGDRIDDIGTYRPNSSTFYRDLNGNGIFEINFDGVSQFGASNDVPIIGDWNGNGRDDIGVYRPSTTAFFRDYNENGAWDGNTTTSGDSLVFYGTFNDTPLIGDWRGDAFTGPVSRAAYDASPGSNVPLDPSNGHWQEGTTDGGAEAAMDPTLTVGTRKLLTDLDYAALDDLGWDIV